MEIWFDNLTVAIAFRKNKDRILNDSLEIATYVLQGLINAELEDPNILLLNYHKYKDNTGSREKIAPSSPLPKIDKYETNLEIYNQLIKKKEELNERKSLIITTNFEFGKWNSIF